MTDQNRGLTVPQTMGVGSLAVGQQEQQTLNDKWTTLPAVEAELTRYGFPPIGPPAHACPPITAELLMSADTRRYSEAFTAVGAWHHFAHNYYARVRSRLLELTTQSKQLDKLIRSEQIAEAKSRGDRKPSKETLDGIVEQHPRYIELLHKKQVEEQKKIIMDSHVEKLDRDLKQLSRQIELRKEDIGGQRMVHNLPGRYSTP